MQRVWQHPYSWKITPKRKARHRSVNGISFTDRMAGHCTRSHLEGAGLQVQQGKGASYHQATRRRTVSVSAVHGGQRRLLRSLLPPFCKSCVIDDCFKWVTEKHRVWNSENDEAKKKKDRKKLGIKGVLT